MPAHNAKVAEDFVRFHEVEYGAGGVAAFVTGHGCRDSELETPEAQWCYIIMPEAAVDARRVQLVVMNDRSLVELVDTDLANHAAVELTHLEAARSRCRFI